MNDHQLIHTVDDCNGSHTERVELTATKAACSALLLMRAADKPDVTISDDKTYAGWMTDQDIVHEYHVIPV